MINDNLFGFMLLKLPKDYQEQCKIKGSLANRITNSAYSTLACYMDLIQCMGNQIK
jgi:hypothetical protein